MNSIRTCALTLVVFGAAAAANAQTYTISPSPFQTAFDNSGRIINNSCVWTYTAGTTTPATTYTTSTGVANANPIRSDSAGRFTAFLQPGLSYKFVYESACTPPAHGTVLRTADNVSAMPTSSASVDITGTAGESITAGQAVYLSAGDGSKSAGQWYKADNANAYSSTTNWVGIATVNIASASTGAIRITGQVTGLSVSIGASYYVGTAGALTFTAPANNVRKLGQADSSTSLVLKDRDAPAAPFVDDFRLSLTTATCMTTSDVTGASAVTLYLTPCAGNRITLFDTSGNVETCTTAEISIAVPATTSQMYDVWVYDSTFGSCTVTLELLAWTNDTTRATAIARSNGRWTKSGNMSRLYRGSFRTTAVSGQTEDSATKRYVWNYYNRDRRPLLRQETTATWTYSTGTLRQANGAAANQVDVVVGVAEANLWLSVTALAKNDTGGVSLTSSIGEDVTNATATGFAGGTGVVITAATYVLNSGFLAKKPAVGRHVYAWLEYATAIGTTTWSGTAAGAGGASGLIGWIEG